MEEAGSSSNLSSVAAPPIHESPSDRAKRNKEFRKKMKEKNRLRKILDKAIQHSKSKVAMEEEEKEKEKKEFVIAEKDDDIRVAQNLKWMERNKKRTDRGWVNAFQGLEKHVVLPLQQRPNEIVHPITETQNKFLHAFSLYPKYKDG